MYQIVTSHSTVTISRAWLTTIIILVVWEAAWKIVALWKAGRNKQLAWFIIMAIINTAGILEIIYIFFLQKKPEDK